MRTLYSKVILQVSSVWSVVMCTLVLLTMLIFPTMRKNKIFMEIVAMIALANIMGNLPYTFGVFPSDGTLLCKYQGFSILYFFPVSWMFTLILAYLLRGLAYTGRLRLLRHHVHILCWGIPFVIVMLRLSTNTFGVIDSLQYITVCTYGGKNIYAGYLWQSICFSGLLLLTCFLMMYWLAEIYYLQVQKSSTVMSVTFTIAKETLFWYPVLLFICWVPYCLFLIAKGPRISSSDMTPLEILLRCLKNLCGGLTAFMFFWKCKESQIRWWKLLHPFICPSGAAAEAELAASRRSAVGFEGDWEEDFEDTFTPTDEIMQSKITSTRLDPAKVAAVLEAHGALDSKDGVIGAAATSNVLLAGNAVNNINQVIFKKTNELNTILTTGVVKSEDSKSLSTSATPPCTAEV